MKAVSRRHALRTLGRLAAAGALGGVAWLSLADKRAPRQALTCEAPRLRSAGCRGCVRAARCGLREVVTDG